MLKWLYKTKVIFFPLGAVQMFSGVCVSALSWWYDYFIRALYRDRSSSTASSALIFLSKWAVFITGPWERIFSRVGTQCGVTDSNTQRTYALVLTHKHTRFPPTRGMRRKWIWFSDSTFLFTPYIYKHMCSKMMIWIQHMWNVEKQRCTV